MEREDIIRITEELESLLKVEKIEEPITEEPVLEESAIEEAAAEEPIIKEPEFPAPEIVGREAVGILGRHGLIAAFVVPVLLMLLIFFIREIFPFGDRSFLRTDMYHQYAPFFSEFQYKLTHGGSLLYSWDVGLGVNFSALYAYYLASPLNWLLILCPKDYVIEFMTYAIVIKTGLCGLSMAYYLQKHCHTKDFGVAFFGIFYAMSGYMAAYSWNIMWLDCILLFPLIMLGLERLVQGKKGYLYCIALGLSILSNYYISILICIFCVLYFVAQLILSDEMTWEKFIASSFKFTLYSLLAGGLAAAVLLPEIYALQMTASGDFNFPKTYSQYFPIFDMIARHIGNVQTEIGLDHWPNIYCGIAVLMLTILYIANGKIQAKEKAVYGVLILILLASFSVNVLNFIWHGFHYPNSLPCRQSFIYIFLVLLIGYRAYMYLRETSWKRVVMAFWGAVVFVILAQKLVTQEHFHFVVYYVAILLLALYLAMTALYRKGGEWKRLAMILTLIIVGVEAMANMMVTSITTVSRPDYINDNKDVAKLMEMLNPSDSFYRVEKVTRKTKNDGAWMNFPSVSLFSSTANADLTEFFKTYGCESSTNSYSITGSTPLIDSMMSVRYGLYSEKPADSILHTLAAQEGETYLYERNYTLPLGYWVPFGFADQLIFNEGNPAELQNGLGDYLGTPHVLNLIMDTTTEGSALSFVPEVSGEYYAYVGSRDIKKVRVYVGEDSRLWNNVDRGYLVEIGYVEAGQYVQLVAEDTDKSMWADIYRFSETAMVEMYDQLSAHPWKLTSWTDTRLDGTIDCTETGVMMTSIPYDEGWRITVDGVIQEPMKLADAFMGVRLTPGRHTVSMTYVPQGLNTGWLISLGSALLLWAVILGTKGYEKRWKGRNERI